MADSLVGDDTTALHGLAVWDGGVEHSDENVWAHRVRRHVARDGHRTLLYSKGTLLLEGWDDHPLGQMPVT